MVRQYESKGHVAHPPLHLPVAFTELKKLAESLQRAITTRELLPAKVYWCDLARVAEVTRKEIEEERKGLLFKHWEDLAEGDKKMRARQEMKWLIGTAMGHVLSHNTGYRYQLQDEWEHIVEAAEDRAIFEEKRRNSRFCISNEIACAIDQISSWYPQAAEMWAVSLAARRARNQPCLVEVIESVSYAVLQWE
jgi:hypothetical protein